MKDTEEWVSSLVSDFLFSSKDGSATMGETLVLDFVFLLVFVFLLFLHLIFTTSFWAGLKKGQGGELCLPCT